MRLEEASFDTDRISRRSFRRFLHNDTDYLLVADIETGLAGYILLLKHRGTRLARLYSICVDASARGRGIAEALMRAGEEAVRERGCAYLRLEVRRDNEPAIRLYRKLGYRLFGTIPHYYEDDQEALRFEKRIRFYSGARSDLFVPYYSQTTPFTCGPACLLMAMRAIDPQAPVDQREELRLWREATTIFMTSGHGGCGPHGLALAAQRRGFNAELFLNDDRVLFIDGLRDERKRQVLGVVHEDYHQQVLAAGIPISYQPLTVEQMASLPRQAHRAGRADQLLAPHAREGAPLGGGRGDRQRLRLHPRPRHQDRARRERHRQGPRPDRPCRVHAHGALRPVLDPRHGAAQPRAQAARRMSSTPSTR